MTDDEIISCTGAIAWSMSNPNHSSENEDDTKIEISVSGLDEMKAANAAGEYKITFSAADGERGTVSITVTVTVLGSTQPTHHSSSSSSGGTSTSLINAVKGTWDKDGIGWKFRYTDGTYAAGKLITDADGNSREKHLWQKIGTGEYAFGSDGYLDIGWVYDDFKWYYCDENKGKLYNWFYSTADGYWYYLSPSTGEALTGWHTINGKDYYLAAAPSAPTYSFDASTGVWIYSNLNGNRPFGSMYANTVTPDNYAVDANGAWIH